MTFASNLEQALAWGLTSLECLQDVLNGSQKAQGVILFTCQKVCQREAEAGPSAGSTSVKIPFNLGCPDVFGMLEAVRS